MADWNFHPRYVTPFYPWLMDGRFVDAPPREQLALVEALAPCVAEPSVDELRAMLRAGWRASAVAAWFIAARRCVELQGEVERLLVERPGHVAPLCVCLARLGGDSAVAALARYYADCSDGALLGRPCDDARTPEWALCAWTQLAGGLSEPRWAAFVEAEMRGLDDAGWFQGRAEFEQRLRDGWNDRFATARRTWAPMQAFAAMLGNRSAR